MSSLVWPIAFMLFVVVGETLILQWMDKKQVNWHDVIFNLNSGHIMLWLFRGLEVTCYGLVVSNFSLGLVSDWPPLLLWIFALFAWDFGFYWLHRLHHRISALWAIHVVHHQGEHFNLSLGVRNSWYSSLTSIPFFMLLAVLGVPLSVFVAVSLINYSIQLFNHNALTPKLGFLEYILVTPSHHRVHHVNDMAYANMNFGGSFIFWDKLFGTFCPQLPETPFKYGAGKNPPSQNPFVASNLPFAKLLRLPIKLTPKSPIFRCGVAMLASGALLLFILVMSYIYRYGYGYDQVQWPQLCLLALIALGSVALGGISEGRRWGISLWLAVVLLLPAIFIFYLNWHDISWLLMFAALLVHAFALLCGWGRLPLAAKAEQND